jgi:hypothetical protein
VILQQGLKSVTAHWWRGPCRTFVGEFLIMADRTEDLNKIVQIYQPNASTRRGGTALEDLSVYQRIALRVSSELDTNDLLMRRMELLSGRKEFSNDPTAAMSEISDLFQKKVTGIKSDMDQLKRLSVQGMVGLDVGGPHQHQHYKLIFQATSNHFSPPSSCSQHT